MRKEKSVDIQKFVVLYDLILGSLPIPLLHFLLKKSFKLIEIAFWRDFFLIIMVKIWLGEINCNKNMKGNYHNFR